jgi:hypothetical protein
MDKVTLWYWPESQTCIGCPNGCFVQGDERVGDSAYICLANKSEMDKDCWSTIIDDGETEHSEVPLQDNPEPEIETPTASKMLGDVFNNFGPIFSPNQPNKEKL